MVLDDASIRQYLWGDKDDDRQVYHFNSNVLVGGDNRNSKDKESMVEALLYETIEKLGPALTSSDDPDLQVEALEALQEVVVAISDEYQLDSAELWRDVIVSLIAASSSSGVVEAPYEDNSFESFVDEEGDGCPSQESLSSHFQHYRQDQNDDEGDEQCMLPEHDQIDDYDYDISEMGTGYLSLDIALMMLPFLVIWYLLYGRTLLKGRRKQQKHVVEQSRQHTRFTHSTKKTSKSNKGKKKKNNRKPNQSSPKTKRIEQQPVTVEAVQVVPQSELEKKSAVADVVVVMAEPLRGNDCAPKVKQKEEDDCCDKSHNFDPYHVIETSSSEE